MNRREAREHYQQLAERHGWPLRCPTCDDKLEDPQNSDYDAFCDFCVAYLRFGVGARDAASEQL